MNELQGQIVGHGRWSQAAIPRSCRSARALESILPQAQNIFGNARVRVIDGTQPSGPPAEESQADDSRGGAPARAPSAIAPDRIPQDRIPQDSAPRSRAAPGWKWQRTVQDRRAACSAAEEGGPDEHALRRSWLFVRRRADDQRRRPRSAIPAPSKSGQHQPVAGQSRPKALQPSGTKWLSSKRPIVPRQSTRPSSRRKSSFV